MQVSTDIEDTSTGLADLFSVCRAVPKTPVLRRDWFIHPIQACVQSMASCICYTLRCPHCRTADENYPQTRCWSRSMGQPFEARSLIESSSDTGTKLRTFGIARAAVPRKIRR